MPPAGDAAASGALGEGMASSADPAGVSTSIWASPSGLTSCKAAASPSCTSWGGSGRFALFFFFCRFTRPGRPALPCSLPFPRWSRGGSSISLSPPDLEGFEPTRLLTCGEVPCPPGGPQARQLTLETVRCGRNRVVLASVPQDASQVVETGVRGLSRTPDNASAGGGPNQHCWTHHAPFGHSIPSAWYPIRCRRAGVDFLWPRRNRGLRWPCALDLSQSIDTHILYACRGNERAYAH